MTGTLRTVTAYGRAGASARVRVFDWLDHLRLDAVSETYLGGASAGVQDLKRAPAATVAAEARLRRLAHVVGDDTVLLSRSASPLSTGAVEARLLRRAQHGVYDFDDALMHEQGHGATRIVAKSRVWRRAVEAADVVVAGNDYLADAASEHTENVVVVPSCVEPDDYVQKTDFELRDAGPRAVWLGSPSTEKYLQLVSAPLLAEHRRSGLRLRVISRGSASLGELDTMVDRVDWTMDGFAADLVDADFGVMPLPDEPWARGKCAYKLLQYGAAGMPMIGSPVGTNARVLAELGGTAASVDAEWGDALTAIVGESSGLREAAGAAARSAVDRAYSFRAWAGTWTDAVKVRHA